MTTYAPTAAMEGLMMHTPLLVRTIAERAGLLFAEREVVSVTATGVERSTYGEVVERAHRLASALHQMGIRPGDRVATFGWNSRRHLELYLAVPSMGAVLHTLNIRLFPEQLTYVINHAEDRVVIVDDSLVPVLARVAGELETIEHFIVVGNGDASPLGEVLRYDDLCPSACSTARRAITTTRWARYSLSAWMSELRPDGAIEIRISAADEKFAANAASISLDRNTTGPAPVTATRTLPPNLAASTPTSA